MTSTAHIRFALTEGERSILLAYLGVALLGAGLSFNIVNDLGGNTEILRPLSGYDGWMILSGMIGACAGLYASRQWFGHQGLDGMRKMLIGIIAITFFAAVIGGTLALPIYGTMFGPFLLAVSLWSHPLLASFWLAVLVASHGLHYIWRKERDTIFAALENDDEGIPD